MNTKLLLIAPAALLVAACGAKKAPPVVDEAHYANSAEGLDALFTDMLAAARSKDDARVKVYAESLKLPDADKWFFSTFPDAGPRLAAEYDTEGYAGFAATAAEGLRGLLEQGRSEVSASCHTSP